MSPPEASRPPARERRIYKRWPLDGRRYWDADLSDYALWLGGGFLLLALVAEISLATDGFAFLYFGELARTHPRRAILAGVLLWNAWLLDAGLTARTPGRSSLAPGLVAGRRLVLLLPLLRLYAIPLWRHVLARAAAGQPPPALGLDSSARHPSGPSSWWNPRSVPVVGWLFGSEYLTVLGAVSWLAHPKAGLAARPTTLLVCAAVFHLLAALGLAVRSVCQLRKRRLRRWQALLVIVLPLFSLLPFLGPILAVLCWAVVHQTSHEPKTLTSLSYQLQNGLRRLAPWNRLQEALRPGHGESWWGIWWKPLGVAASEEESRVEHQLRSLYRLKALLLALDAACLTWLLPRLLGATSIVAVPSWALELALAVVGLGVLISFLGAGGRILRRGRVLPRLVREPFGRYLMLVPLLALAGSYTASLVPGGGGQLGWWLLEAGAAGFFALAFAVVTLALTVGLSNSTQNAAILYAAFFLVVVGTGLVLLAAPEGAPRLAGAFWLGPAGGLCLSFTATPWLVRPLRASQVLSCQLSPGRRVVLGCLVLTAALPLGGLAIPLWILVRRSSWPDLPGDPPEGIG